MTKKLMPANKVPEMIVKLVGGETWTLAEQTPENFTMVVVYRGYHCPICKGYLKTLDELVERYEAAGFTVIAVSMDGEERAAKAREEWGLSNLAIGYELSEETATAWGLWLSNSIKDAEAATFTEPGVFWVRPDGNLYLADISNMPIARPDLEFMLSKVSMLVENDYPARGTRLAA